jgi:DNA-binding transcriptional LysR family regulator
MAQRPVLTLLDLWYVRALLSEAEGGRGFYMRAKRRTGAGVSQLNAAIDRLEKSVGSCLLERGSKRRVAKLTPAGERFLAALTPVLAAWAAARYAAKAPSEHAPPHSQADAQATTEPLYEEWEPPEIETP